MNRASTTKSTSCFVSNSSVCFSACVRSIQSTLANGSLFFFASPSSSGRLETTSAGSALSRPDRQPASIASITWLSFVTINANR